MPGLLVDFTQGAVIHGQPISHALAFGSSVGFAFLLQAHAHPFNDVFLHGGRVGDIHEIKSGAANLDVDNAEIEQQAKESCAFVLGAQNIFKRGRFSILVSKRNAVNIDDLFRGDLVAIVAPV